MAASSSPPIEKSEGTRTIEDMSLTELYGAQRMLEDAKVCSVKLFVEALKSLAKLQYEACLEQMAETVEQVGLESCGGEQSYLDIFDMITKLAAANPDIVEFRLLYRYMQQRISNSTVLADEAAKRVSPANAKNKSTDGDSLEVQPHSSEMEVQPYAPELEVQLHSSEMQVQLHSSGMEFQPNAPEIDVQHNASELEVQPNAPEPEVQPNAPKLEVQLNAPEPEVQPDAPELKVQANAPQLDVQPNAPELEVQQHSSDSEVQSQSFDPEDPSTASSRLSLYMQISPDGSVGDDTPPNYDELNLHRSYKPQIRSDRSNLTFPLSSDESSKGQTNSAVGYSEDQSYSALGSSEDQSNSAVGSSADQSDSALGSSEDQSNSAVGSSADQSDSAVGSSAEQSNSALGSSEVQSNSAVGSSEIQSHSTFGSSDSQAYSSGPHSSDGSPDACSPNSFLIPAGVYVNLEVGLAYIAQFKTLEEHQEYLMNMTHEIISIGENLELLKEELKKLKDQSRTFPGIFSPPRTP